MSSSIFFVNYCRLDLIHIMHQPVAIDDEESVGFVNGEIVHGLLGLDAVNGFDYAAAPPEAKAIWLGEIKFGEGARKEFKVSMIWAVLCVM